MTRAWSRLRRRGEYAITRARGVAVAFGASLREGLTPGQHRTAQLGLGLALAIVLYGRPG